MANKVQNSRLSFARNFYISRKYAVPKFATSCSCGTLCDIIPKPKKLHMKKRITIILLLLNSIMAISQEIKYINANQLNVRSGAGKNFEIVTKASKNERVTVLSDNGSWTEVETESGEKGFVSSKFLSNSINENNDAKIGDYPIASIIVGLILVFLIFRIKKFLNNIFNFSSKKSTVNKSVTKKIINKPKQIVVKEKVTENDKKEIVEKEIFLCKNCGSQYGSISLLTLNNCKNTNGKHQLYEGKIKSQYNCKFCGSKYNSIFQMTINNCKKSPTGKHQPAL